MKPDLQEWYVYHPGSREVDGPYHSESLAMLEQTHRGGNVIGPYRPFKPISEERRRTLMETKQTREVIEHFFKELENPKDKLTDWELQFLESIQDQFNRKGSLSTKQFQILERIYAERTA